MPEYSVIDGQRVELTEWFPTLSEPVRIGDYQARVSSWPFPGFVEGEMHWDGADWRYLIGSNPGRRWIRNDHKAFEWRGLAHPPGAT